jgi:hypothetical protein
MIKEKGGVNAAVFIEFLKRLITGAARAIFLIVDRGPAHIAKRPRENPFLLPKAISQIRRMKVNLLMD